MKEELLKLGFEIYPLYSVDGWECYHKKMIWFFVDDTNSHIRIEPNVDITMNIEEIKYIIKKLEII